MLVFCCFTPAHRVLFDQVFLPSIPNDMEVRSTMLDLPGRGDFLSAEFLQCIRDKICLVRQSIDLHRGEIIAWSDVDIRFFRSVSSELSTLLQESGHSIMFQREDRVSHEVNTGFFVCRCGDPVLRLFEQVHSLLERNPGWNEQRCINSLISTGELTGFGRLPLTYFARTHGWPPPRDARIYHANYTMGPDGVGQKIRQFAEADAAIRGTRLQRLGTIIRAGARLGPRHLAQAARRRLGRLRDR